MNILFLTKGVNFHIYADKFSHVSFFTSLRYS
jgi:hypothetical protein